MTAADSTPLTFFLPAILMRVSRVGESRAELRARESRMPRKIGERELILHRPELLKELRPSPQDRFEARLPPGMKRPPRTA
jgi:hypothetical protein